jgi:hypothetical protein
MEAKVHGDGKRTIAVYDSIGRHARTWLYAGILRLFAELIGEYHPPFKGLWSLEVCTGHTVLQKAYDCGVFTAWAGREIFANGEFKLATNNSLELGKLLRRKFIGKCGSQSTLCRSTPWRELWRIFCAAM